MKHNKHKPQNYIFQALVHFNTHSSCRRNQRVINAGDGIIGISQKSRESEFGH